MRHLCTVLVYLAFGNLNRLLSLNGFLGLDALGLLVLSVISVLFLMVSFYLMGYFKNESDLSHRIFIGFLLFFLSFMTLVTVSRHFGLLLIGIEATTLSSVPLINFVKTRQSIEATWKFLDDLFNRDSLGPSGDIFSGCGGYGQCAKPFY